MCVNPAKRLVAVVSVALAFAPSSCAVAGATDDVVDAPATSDDASDALGEVLDDAPLSDASPGDAAPGDAAPSDAAPSDAPPSDGAPTEPDVDTIAWATGTSVGNGIASKDTQNPTGQSAAIIYAGYGSTLAGAEAWTTALYRATLRDRGVRYLWAVQGPIDVQYTAKEIGNTKLAAALVPKVSASTKFVLVLGHSSGSYVAHELLGMLGGGSDPASVTAGRVVYFDLDGAIGGLTTAMVTRLRKAYFVGGYDSTIATTSPNDVTMRSAGTSYGANGSYYQLAATGSGCLATAIWCLHMTVVTTKPHNLSAADTTNDYADFVGRPVARAFLDDNAVAAGLLP